MVITARFTLILNKPYLLYRRVDESDELPEQEPLRSRKVTATASTSQCNRSEGM